VLNTKTERTDQMPIISHSIATQNENHFAITVESRQSAREHTQSKRCHQPLPATKITREQQWRRKVEKYQLPMSTRNFVRARKSTDEKHRRRLLLAAMRFYRLQLLAAF
jgi:hypothetical protein